MGPTGISLRRNRSSPRSVLGSDCFAAEKRVLIEPIVHFLLFRLPGSGFDSDSCLALASCNLNSAQLTTSFRNSIAVAGATGWKLLRNSFGLISLFRSGRKYFQMRNETHKPPRKRHNNNSSNNTNMTSNREKWWKERGVIGRVEVCGMASKNNSELRAQMKPV